MFESVRGVQQGCNLGPLCYSAGALKILKEFRSKPPVPGARAVSFIDDITVILPPELSLDMSAIENSHRMATRAARGRMNLAEPKQVTCAFGEWSRTRRPDGEQQIAVDRTRLTVVGRGMRVVGVPVGTEQFKRIFCMRQLMENPPSL